MRVVGGHFIFNNQNQWLKIVYIARARAIAKGAIIVRGKTVVTDAGGMPAAKSFHNTPMASSWNVRFAKELELKKFFKING